jgi:hypothetical protein
MMMNSGSGRLIVASGSGKGVIYKKAGREVPPRDVITWHDVEPYRIWIHSRLKDQGFISVSLEIQVLGSGLKDRAVNMNEAQAREQLASLIEANTDDAYRLNPRIWRNIQVGSLMGAHAILVRDIQIALTSEVTPKLTLVEEGAVKISKLRESKPSKNGQSGFDKEIRASTEDSLLITFIYHTFVSAGLKQAASRVAHELNIEPKFVYTALRTARKKGWLTSTGIGSSGGVMTEDGLKEFEISGARERYEIWLRMKAEGKY